MLELTLPLPPSINTYYKKYRNRLMISPEGREFRQNVIGLVNSTNNIERFDKDDRLYLEVKFYPPDNRRRDLDNFCGKALQDALQHAGIYPDDSQLDVVSYQRMDSDKKWPRVEIILDKIEEFDVDVEDADSENLEFHPNHIFLLMEMLALHLDEHISEDFDARMMAIEEDPDFPIQLFEVFLELVEKFNMRLMDKESNPNEIGAKTVMNLLKKLDIEEKLN